MRQELLEIRKSKHKTQEQIAIAVGIDRTAYCRIERGERKPSVDVAIKIAKELGVRVEDIFLPDSVVDIHNIV